MQRDHHNKLVLFPGKKSNIQKMLKQVLSTSRIGLALLRNMGFRVDIIQGKCGSRFE